ncbi:MAG: adenosylcobinamide-phosphate synthase CbiB [Methanoregula sp.]|nr:adenosylcobinamide-phosphate synthase CbiB [Methanoregula sp.]
MVPSAVEAGIIVLFAALVVDRLLGDPQSSLHPVAVLGRFIGFWGKPEVYSLKIQQFLGVIFWLVTVVLFAIPFYYFTLLSPWYLYLIIAPFLLKICFAWRSLEEHTMNVGTALKHGVENGRAQAGMMVSRDTAHLEGEHILSAGYESMTENLTDSIISPLFYYSLSGLAGAAVYRAVNTMDAMLGYRDQRIRLGWCSARMDDIFNFIPARITVFLLLVYFSILGRFSESARVMRRDGHKRPGYNGGIVMAAMAGGIGIRFEKPGVYTIGDGERSLDEAGSDIIRACRFVTIIFAFLSSGTLILLGSLINSTGI